MAISKSTTWIAAVVLGSSLGILLVAFPISEEYTSLSVSNKRTVDTTVYVSFGSDSRITANDWTFCNGSGLNCNFVLGANSTKPLPNPSGSYINATFSFDAPVGCGVTKAEVNINNPSWADTLDVSLVDGYSNDIQMLVTTDAETPTTLGPPKGESGNEKVFGLFPYGCDICVERQNPPCGISKGKEGCKKGTQYDPDVPCQYQAPASENLSVEVQLL